MCRVVICCPLVDKIGKIIHCFVLSGCLSRKWNPHSLTVHYTASPDKEITTTAKLWKKNTHKWTVAMSLEEKKKKHRFLPTFPPIGGSRRQAFCYEGWVSPSSKMRSFSCTIPGWTSLLPSPKHNKENSAPFRCVLLGKWPNNRNTQTTAKGCWPTH